MSKNTKNQYLVAVDIGNTAVHLALLQGLRTVAEHRISSRGTARQMKKEITAVSQGWVRKAPGVSGVMICSVVPPLTGRVGSVCRTAFGCKPVIVGKDVIPPIQNRYRVPGQVGQDRLVGAFAAKCLYGPPLIVIDLGTATTFDIVSGRGDYLGAVIVPGIGLSAETLSCRTALLPWVRVRKPQGLIARDTENSIISGLYYGYGEMIKGLVREMKKEIPSAPRVILTGGYAPLYYPYVKKNVSCLDETLIFKGMALMWSTGAPSSSP